MLCCIATYWVLIGQNFVYYNSSGKMPSDKASICSPTQIPPAPLCHLPGPYLLIVLQHLRPNKDWVIFIATKNEKAVTVISQIAIAKLVIFYQNKSEILNF